jgi:hypothetical protein
VSTNKRSFLREKWKEYSIEFFSIFTAVTLSFFADNLREELQIKQRMKENYQDLLQDLRQDSIRIDALSKSSRTERVKMHQLLDLIYKFQDQKITWEEVKLNMPKIEELPFYFTLIMSNSTFNSMQSSGMLSEINNSKLLQQLTYYYDVLAKKLDESNTIYDVDRRRFYDEYFPLIQPTSNRRLDSTEGRVNALSAPYRDPQLNKEFILNLPVAKQIMTDPQTLFRSEAFYLRFGIYLQLLKTLNEENRKLITSVESAVKD